MQKEVYKTIDKISSKEDFVKFMELIVYEMQHNKNDWQNNTLESFLDGLWGISRDIQGSYKNKGKVFPKEPSWQIFAELLYTALIYD